MPGGGPLRVLRGLEKGSVRSRLAWSEMGTRWERGGLERDGPERSNQRPVVGPARSVDGPKDGPMRLSPTALHGPLRRCPETVPERRTRKGPVRSSAVCRRCSAVPCTARERPENGTLARGSCRGGLVARFSSQGCSCRRVLCHGVLVAGTSSRRCCHGLFSRGLCHGVLCHAGFLVTETLPHGPCHGVLCHRDLATGSLSQTFSKGVTRFSSAYGSSVDAPFSKRAHGRGAWASRVAPPWAALPALGVGFKRASSVGRLCGPNALF
mmetsp:Transcript_31535/g.109067  ORF Transcript_31535/g.109067 Transcript_31535/m.109067 type:complete len:267 (+) Transcript_31535:209-1009(+)